MDIGGGYCYNGWNVKGYDWIGKIFLEDNSMWIVFKVIG